MVYLVTCFQTLKERFYDKRDDIDFLTKKLLKQGYQYHKFRKTFSKFYRRY